MEQKNLPEYLKHVEDGAFIRKDVDQIYAPRLHALSRMFKFYFGRDFFKHLNDQKYYETVHYPNDDSPFKHETVLNRFGQMYNYFHWIGKSAVYDDFLESQYGIKIVETYPGAIEAYVKKEIGFKKEKEKKKFKDMWEYEFGLDKPTDDKVTFEKMIFSGQEAQRDICINADKVKIDLATEVEDGLEIKKKYFMRAVYAKLKAIIKGDEAIEVLKEKIETDRNLEDESLNPVIYKDTK